MDHASSSISDNRILHFVLRLAGWPVSARYGAIDSFGGGLSSSMSGRSERAGKRIGCAAIVVAAGVGLGLSAHHDVQFTRSITTVKSLAGANAELRQGQCVFDAIRLEVPEGATVYVTDTLSEPVDHLVEWSTPWAVPELDIAGARYQLTLVPPPGRRLFPFPLTRGAPDDPAKGQCEGLTLEVRRL
jgi:hypothetical protein